MVCNPAFLLTFSYALYCFSASAAPKKTPEYVPADPINVNTIYSPGGVQIRYKEPEICETTPGVRSYSGYVDLDADTNIFFWFFEARNNPSTAPTTLWLTGGPGDDSLLATFLENGPCSIADENSTRINHHSWNNASNMLYLSQPIGVGFSYSAEGIGWLDSYSGDVYPPDTTSLPSLAAFRRWPVINASTVDTMELAAIAAYHTIQALFYHLPQFHCEIKSRSFNLWTESYGGHYGPVFYDYFYEQNQAIANGSVDGVLLNFDSLGIGNGLIDYAIQVHDYITFALTMDFGCLDQILHYCRPYLALPSPSTPSIKSICQEAADMCNENVLGTDCPSPHPHPSTGPWESYSTRCLYDIRTGSQNCAPNPSAVERYLNHASTQTALGVNLNYTSQNNAVFLAFQASGDWVSQSTLSALASLLNNGVRVALYYGDADFIANWFGGEAVSLAVDYAHAHQFRAAGYAPLVVNGSEYGVVRQYGNFSFLRVDGSGHQVPFFQPLAAPAMFQRTIEGLDVATGTMRISETYQTNGTVHATHTEAVVTRSAGERDRDCHVSRLEGRNEQPCTTRHPHPRSRAAAP